MNPKDKERILRFKDGVASSATLKIKTDDSRPGQTIKGFCDAFSTLLPNIRFKKDNDMDTDMPGFLIEPNILYHLAPTDRELEPFLNLISDPEKQMDRISPSVKKALTGLKIPAFLTLFVTTNCPHCPEAANLVLGLAGCSANIRLSVIDGGLFPDVVDQKKIRSAPTLILDDQFRWSGRMDPDEVVQMMIQRDPSQLGAGALKGMIEDGNAGMVADMMLENNQIFPAFIDLLVHDKWPVRLGAMVAFETLAETRIQLARAVAEPIWKRFDRVDETVKGDILHVMGESGNADFAPELKTVLDGPFGADVKEAAMEALEKIGDAHP